MLPPYLRSYRRPRSPLPGPLRTAHAARTDAAMAIPHGDDPAAWLLGVRSDCSSWAEALARAWSAADARLLARWQALQAESAALAAELHLARQEESRLLTDPALPPPHPERQNPMAESLSGRGYAGALALLVVLELPLVFISFTALGLDPIMTGLLSVLCAGLTAFLGHALGTVTHHLRVGARWLLGILLGLSLLFIGALAWLRESALAVIGSDLAMLNPASAAVALFAIALASLAAAALLAWHHSVDPDRRPLHRAQVRRRGWERRLARLQRHLGRTEARRSALHKMARQEVLAMGQAMLSRFHRYARINQLHRDQHGLATALQSDNLPRLELPALLSEPLDWARRSTPV